MDIDPFLISATVVAVIMIVTIGMLMGMSKPETIKAEQEDTLDPIDKASR